MREEVPQELASALALNAPARGRIGTPLHYFQEIGSTNDEAARLAEHGASDGTTVVAAAQTAGRGRLGRTWFSPPGAGLYVSVVLRQPAGVPLLSLAGGVAVAEGIRTATGLPVHIKWPNDVVVDTGGGRRKLAGILAEAASSTAGVQHVVLGFGINLRESSYPKEISAIATSIESELGREISPGPVLAESLASLARYLDQLSRGEWRPLLDRWRALSPSARGASVSWQTADGVRRGRTSGIDEDGALLVTCGGSIERIISGTVIWNEER